jgi:acyl-CoA thioesterase I
MKYTRRTINRVLCRSAILLYSLVNITLADTTRVACVGNSITDGTGLAGRDSLCYPAQLQKMLGPTYKVQNDGLAGATMLKNGNKPYWTFGGGAQFKAALAFLPNIVLIKLGTNDSKSSGGVDNWPSHKNEYVGDYESMVDTFSGLSSHPKVWACYPIPAFSTAYLIDSLVIHYEILPKIKTVVLDKGIPLIDLFTVMTPNKNLYGDGIHPNAQGYTVIAQKIHQMLKADTLTLAKSKSKLTAPAGGSLYRWYRMGKPVSGAIGQTYTATDTGAYRALVGQSASNDDMLTTNSVRVTKEDLSSATLPFVMRAASRTIAPRGEVSLYALDGRKIATAYSAGDRSYAALFKREHTGTLRLVMVRTAAGSFLDLHE